MSVENNVLSRYYPVGRMFGWVNVYRACVRGLLLDQVGLLFRWATFVRVSVHLATASWEWTG